MAIHITDFARQRQTTKAYAPRRISDADMVQVRQLLRFSPFSTNLQPWHFVIAGKDEGKARVAKAAVEKFPFNFGAINNASHVVVFAGRIHADEAYLKTVLAQEEADGRFAGNPDEFKPAMHTGRSMFVDIHQDQIGDGQQWMAHQVYLNLGQFLIGLATLGIDATPMEGVDTEVLDAAFGLRDKGYASLFVVPIGYSDPDADYNAALPKSRLIILADEGNGPGGDGTKAALVTIDMKTGKTRRLLQGHESCSSEDVPIKLGDRVLTVDVEGTPLRIGADGIVADLEYEWLYFGPLSGSWIYRVRLDDIAD